MVQKKQLSQYVIGVRDPLGFLLHDLIHADRYFRHERLFWPQKGFFKLMVAALDQNIFHPLLTSDPAFKEELDYVLSDMNAYCGHQLKYLKAVIFHYYLRRAGETREGTLPHIYQAAYEKFCSDLFDFWQMSDKVKAGALRLNTPDSQIMTDLPPLEDFFCAKGKEDVETSPSELLPALDLNYVF